MNTTLTAAIIAASLLVAVLLGMRVRRRLPQHHLSEETKDTVKLAMGLVATMSALLLGLLVSSAKGSYDTVRNEVVQMAAKVTFLDRVLDLYGAEAAPLRARYHAAVKEVVREMWSEEEGAQARDFHTGDALYAAIQGLTPRDDAQLALKTQATSLAVELAQLRTLLRAQSATSISRPLLLVVVLWLVVIFFSFSLLAPPNALATGALMVSSLSVAAAIFLILEMDRPFTGLIRISSEPLANALL